MAAWPGPKAGQLQQHMDIEKVIDY